MKLLHEYVVSLYMADGEVIERTVHLDDNTWDHSNMIAIDKILQGNTIWDHNGFAYPKWSVVKASARYDKTIED